MVKPFCDECKKELVPEKAAISVSEVVFIDPKGSRGARGLHFCDTGCANSWLIKNANKPHLVQLPNAN